MKLVITPTATEDLEALARYLGPRSPGGLEKVLAAIQVRMVMLSDGLIGGRETFRGDVREVVEPSYGYVIPYYIEGDRIYVLRIYSGRRRPLTPEDIELSLVKRSD